MKLNTLTKLMKWIIALFIAASAVLLTGCGTMPISTRMEAEIAGVPVKYKSEKDLKVIKRSYDAESGNLVEEIEVEAVASAPALAQAERDKIQAEVNARALEMANKIISGAIPVP